MIPASQGISRVPLDNSCEAHTVCLTHSKYSLNSGGCHCRSLVIASLDFPVPQYHEEKNLYNSGILE